MVGGQYTVDYEFRAQRLERSHKRQQQHLLKCIIKKTWVEGALEGSLVVGRWTVGGRLTTYRPPTNHFFRVQLVQYNPYCMHT